MMSVGTKKAIFLTICILLIIALLVGVVVTFLSRQKDNLCRRYRQVRCYKEIEEAMRIYQEDTRARF